MYRSQKLSLRYFTAAIVLFGVMILFGLLSALYYLYPSMLFNVFNFNNNLSYGGTQFTAAGAQVASFGVPTAAYGARMGQVGMRFDF